MYPSFQKPYCFDWKSAKYISSFIRIREWSDVFYLHLLYHTNQEIAELSNYSVRSVQRIISRCYDIVVGELYHTLYELAPYIVERSLNE